MLTAPPDASPCWSGVNVLRDLDALDDGRGKLIELYRALLRIGRRETKAVQLRDDVPIGQTADDRILAILDRGPGDQAERTGGVTDARPADQVGADRVHQSRVLEPKTQKTGLGAATDLQILNDELLHLRELAGQRGRHLGQLPRRHDHVGLDLSRVPRLREDQRVRPGRNLGEHVVSLFGAGHLLTGLHDQDLREGQRHVEVLVRDHTADRARLLSRGDRDQTQDRQESRTPDQQAAVHHGRPSPSRIWCTRARSSASGSTPSTAMEQHVADRSSARGLEFGLTTPASTACL